MLYRQGQASDRRPAGAPSDAVDEAALIHLVVARDLHAFERLYRLYHPRLSRFLGNILRRQHLVEEALDDTMMVVWNRCERYDGSSKVSTWIFAIAYRIALKARSRWDDPIEDALADLRPSPDPGPEQEFSRHQIQGVLLQAMSQLSTEHRTVVDLTYFHEAGYGEIAEIMDCPVGTVKTRMYHARRHLKEALASRFADWL